MLRVAHIGSLATKAKTHIDTAAHHRSLANKTKITRRHSCRVLGTAHMLPLDALQQHLHVSGPLMPMTHLMLLAVSSRATTTTSWEVHMRCNMV